MANKLKRSILFLLMISLLIPAYILSASAAETREIVVPAGATSFDVNLTVNESGKYAGIEFGLTLSNETALSFVSFEQGDAIKCATASPFTTVTGIHYFGFYKNSNAYSGNIKAGTLHFTYTGDTTQTITLTNMKVWRIDTNNRTTGTEKDSPVVVLTIKRVASNNGNDITGGTGGGNTGGGSAGGGSSSGSNNEITINDNLAPLAGAKNSSFYFDDVNENWLWAVNEIDSLYEAGVVKGTAPRIYSPSANITRGDFMLMLVRAFDLRSKTDGNFLDVPQDSYFYEAIAIAKALGIAKGDGVNFNPLSPITRQDMMVLVHRTFEVLGKSFPSAEDSVLSAFSDGAQIASYARDAVGALVNSGIIKGNGSGINPLGFTTRAEMAVVIYRLSELATR